MAKRSRAQKEFIRARAHLTPRAILAEAKQARFRLNITQIYTQRSIDTHQARVVARRAAQGVPPMTPKVIRKRTRAQKEFIRAREHLTPRETLAEAKQAGLRLSINQIYSQRTIDVRNAVLAGERAAKPRARASRPAKQASADAERQLRVAVAKLGLDRARDIIDELERAVLKR